MVAVELEVLAKKYDRYGWERDRGTPAHDRLVIDWMDALQDYPLSEVRDACRAVVRSSPSRMPNEGHVVAAILEARRRALLLRPRPAEPELRPVDRVTAEKAAEILRKAGFAPKVMQ